jgi:hypothetical protein
VRPIHHTHPTLADLLDDAVVAQGVTDEVSHCEWFPASNGTAEDRRISAN